MSSNFLLVELNHLPKCQKDINRIKKDFLLNDVKYKEILNFETNRYVSVYRLPDTEVNIHWLESYEILWRRAKPRDQRPRVNKKDLFILMDLVNSKRQYLDSKPLRDIHEKLNQLIQERK